MKNDLIDRTFDFSNKVIDLLVYEANELTAIFATISKKTKKNK